MHVFRNGGTSIERIEDSKVPIRPAKVLAAELLRRSQIKAPPVNLGRVALELGDVEIHYLNLDGDGYLVRSGTKQCDILASERTKASGRSRFTIAHELGHVVACRVADAKGHRQTVRQADSHTVEAWCDDFAANLLMPESILKPRLSGLSSNGVGNLLSQAPTEFMVSRQALETRVSEICNWILAFYQKGPVPGLERVVRVVPKVLDTEEIRNRLGRVLESILRGSRIPTGPSPVRIDERDRNVVFTPEAQGG